MSAIRFLAVTGRVRAMAEPFGRRLSIEVFERHTLTLATRNVGVNKFARRQLIAHGFRR